MNWVNSVRSDAEQHVFTEQHACIEQTVAEQHALTEQHVFAGGAVENDCRGAQAAAGCGACRGHPAQ